MTPTPSRPNPLDRFRRKHPPTPSAIGDRLDPYTARGRALPSGRGLPGRPPFTPAPSPPSLPQLSQARARAARLLRPRPARLNRPVLHRRHAIVHTDNVLAWTLTLAGETYPHPQPQVPPIERRAIANVLRSAMRGTNRNRVKAWTARRAAIELGFDLRRRWWGGEGGPNPQRPAPELPPARRTRIPAKPSTFVTPR